MSQNERSQREAVQGLIAAAKALLADLDPLTLRIDNARKGGLAAAIEAVEAAAQFEPAPQPAQQPEPVRPEPDVRVFRILEYRGPQAWVEKQIRNSIHGTKVVSATAPPIGSDYYGVDQWEKSRKGYITATTLTEFPEAVGLLQPTTTGEQVPAPTWSQFEAIGQARAHAKAAEERLEQWVGKDELALREVQEAIRSIDLMARGRRRES